MEDLKNNQKLKMYVSLPMTGIADNNIQMETAAYGIACRMGYWVFRPSKISEKVKTLIEKPLYRHYLGFDIWSLCRMDAVLLCPGWEQSQGCRTEVRFAMENGIEIYDYRTQELMDMAIIEKGLNPCKCEPIEEYQPERSKLGEIGMILTAIALFVLALNGLVSFINLLLK